MNRDNLQLGKRSRGRRGLALLIGAAFGIGAGGVVAGGDLLPTARAQFGLGSMVNRLGSAGKVLNRINRTARDIYRHSRQYRNRGGDGGTSRLERFCTSRGLVVRGGRCACAAGAKWSEKLRRCLDGRALFCAERGLILRQGRCACPVGATWNEAQRRCIYTPEGRAAFCKSKGLVLSGARCVCPTGTQWDQRKRSCIDPNAWRAEACRAKGLVYRAGRCACPAGTKWIAAMGRCTEVLDQRAAFCWKHGLVYRGNRCVCPTGKRWSNSARACVGGPSEAPAASATDESGESVTYRTRRRSRARETYRSKRRRAAPTTCKTATRYFLRCVRSTRVSRYAKRKGLSTKVYCLRRSRYRALCNR